jgi:elongin-A
MPVKSLVELATAACVKNIRHLESVGDYLPYENVRQILWRVDNAPQLRRIEINSPQLDGRTGEIWLKLIEREFPIEYKANKYKPQNPSKWYRVWEKYKREHDSAIEESENKLKNALAGLRQDKEKNTSKIVERRLLPRTGRTVPRRTHGGASAGSSTLNFTGGSRTKTLNGASIMRKVRREVKEIANIHGSLSRAVRGPVRISEVRKAPQAMINDHRRATQPSNEPKYRPVKVSAAVTEHEKRATFISDSEDNDEDDDDDGMWDEPRKQRAPPSSAFARPAASKAAAKSAAASLLKTRQAASSTSRTVRPVDRNSDPVRGSSASSSISRPSSSRPPPTQSPARASSSYEQNSRTGKPAPLSSHVGPASPPSDAPPPVAGSPEPRPRKRKAVDIFMKPRKR